jgi:hypothetical protein
MLTRLGKRQRIDRTKQQAFHPHLLATSFAFLDICDVAWRVQRVCREWRRIVQTCPACVSSTIILPPQLLVTLLHNGREPLSLWFDRFMAFALGPRTRQLVFDGQHFYDVAYNTSTSHPFQLLKLHKRCPNLETLIVQRYPIRDTTLEVIGKCKSLRRLQLPLDLGRDFARKTSLTGAHCLSHIADISVGTESLELHDVRALLPVAANLTRFSMQLPSADPDEVAGLNIALATFFDATIGLSTLSITMVMPYVRDGSEFVFLATILRSKFPCLRSLTLANMDLPMCSLVHLRRLADRGVHITWRGNDCSALFQWMDSNEERLPADLDGEMIDVISHHLEVCKVGRTE